MVGNPERSLIQSCFGHTTVRRPSFTQLFPADIRFASARPGGPGYALIVLVVYMVLAC